MVDQIDGFKFDNDAIVDGVSDVMRSIAWKTLNFNKLSNLKVKGITCSGIIICDVTVDNFQWMNTTDDGFGFEIFG